jgi:hypothetical protein
VTDTLALPAPELIVYEIRDSEGNVLADGIGRLERLENGNMTIIDVFDERQMRITQMNTERDQTIYRLRQNGVAFQEISDRFGISRQRIHSILLKIDQQRARAEQRDRELINTADLVAASDAQLAAIAARLEAIDAELGELETEMNMTAPAARDFSVFGLELSTRARNVLASFGCLTVGDVMKLRDLEFLLLPNCGRKTLHEIREAVHALGLKMADDSRREQRDPKYGGMDGPSIL